MFKNNTPAGESDRGEGKGAVRRGPEWKKERDATIEARRGP